eukprot:1428344-Pleurochrysis_carterae.AAC.1
MLVFATLPKTLESNLALSCRGVPAYQCFCMQHLKVLLAHHQATTFVEYVQYVARAALHFMHHATYVRGHLIVAVLYDMAWLEMI